MLSGICPPPLQCYVYYSGNCGKSKANSPGSCGMGSPGQIMLPLSSPDQRSKADFSQFPKDALSSGTGRQPLWSATCGRSCTKVRGQDSSPVRCARTLSASSGARSKITTIKPQKPKFSRLFKCSNSFRPSFEPAPKPKSQPSVSSCALEGRRSRMSAL